MPVPSGLSDEDAAQFRTSEVVENVAEAGIILGQAKKRIFEYREGLTKEIQKTAERLEFMHKQRDELDQWLQGDALKAWARENEPQEGNDFEDEGPVWDEPNKRNLTTDMRRDRH